MEQMGLEKKKTPKYCWFFFFCVCISLYDSFSDADQHCLLSHFYPFLLADCRV